jgi:hypothetical protein
MWWMKSFSQTCSSFVIRMQQTICSYIYIYIYEQTMCFLAEVVLKTGLIFSSNVVLVNVYGEVLWSSVWSIVLWRHGKRLLISVLLNWVETVLKPDWGFCVWVLQSIICGGRGILLCFITVMLLLRKLYCQRLNGKLEQNCWLKGISRGQGRIWRLPSFGIFRFL